MLGLVHAVEAPEAADKPEFIAYGYVGPVGVGLPNLTLNVKPPVKPQPEDEQGVGRAPGMQWESREHPVYDNPDYYLAQPQVFFEPHDFPGGAPTRVEGASHINAVIELNYYQQHQATTSPGTRYQETTVPNRQAVPNTQISRLA